MAWFRTSLVCAAAAAALFSVHAFVVPTAGPSSLPTRLPTTHTTASAATGASSFARSWTLASSSLAIGAHIGLLVAAARSTSTARKAEAAKEAKKVAKKAKAPAEPVVSAVDERLFEKVFFEYTKEYLKGPMYWCGEKLPGMNNELIVGDPWFKNGVAQVRGQFKTFSSNELAAVSLLFFGIGLYGVLMFNVYDDQFLVVDQGGQFNPLYIIESQFLFPSWILHLLCYAQKKAGK
jgi:hypothetical protein